MGLYRYINRFFPGKRVRSEDINQQFEAIEDAFDQLPDDSEKFVTGRQIFIGELVRGANNAYTGTTGSNLTIQTGDRFSFITSTPNTPNLSLIHI